MVGRIRVVHQTLFLCPCCSGQTDVLPDHIAHHCLRANDHYNRDIAITFGAQLISFRACLRAEIAQQSAVSQFAKMLIVDYHSVKSTSSSAPSSVCSVQCAVCSVQCSQWGADEEVALREWWNTEHVWATVCQERLRPSPWISLRCTDSQTPLFWLFWHRNRISAMFSQC